MAEYTTRRAYTESRQHSTIAPTNPYHKENNSNKSSESNSSASISMSSSNVATTCDQETFIPQLQPPQFKTSKGGPPVPNFEYVSYDKVQDLYDQNKGSLYFIPEGFEPVLVPNDAKATSVTNLLENAKPVSNAPNVSRMLPDTDVRLPSFALPCGVAGPTPKATSANSKTKVKKPPRPPNAFILYRRAKQPGIVAKNQGITNNEVSKEIGRMWHEEPQDVRLKFQKMADAAKQEHMKKYPEYRYRPRRPQERKRRIQPREDSPPTQGSTPTLSSQSLPMIDTSAFFPRRISISTDGENSEIFTPTTMVTSHNSNILQNPQHLLYANNSLTSSPQQLGYLDPTMGKYEYGSYIDDQNSYDNSPISNATTTFVNTPMTTSGGMIDFSVFDAPNQTAPGEAMGYYEYVDTYDSYDNMAHLGFDEQQYQQIVKYDY
ncbi:2502_t:CDS:1 [Acaulospora morrowiae]|uniref:2502_t:CDS:1 n=1 Tax=Acaulospora morrowiae TaxID=94023 RepID=A0A9N9FE20_9GLOM|nr:2502_t:CDS:1 [Acaulospora morrowiae]